MQQIAMLYWNKIAKSPKIQTATYKHLFSLSEDEIDLKLDKQGDELINQSIENKTVLAYQLVAPLLIEREAIQQWAAENDKLELFPELLNIKEALELADNEYQLTSSQTEALKKLLNNLIET